MLGTILYMALDISFNATMWAIKQASNGIYYGTTYLLGIEDNNNNDDKNNILMIKLNEQNKKIDILTNELRELKKYNN